MIILLPRLIKLSILPTSLDIFDTQQHFIGTLYTCNYKGTCVAQPVAYRTWEQDATSMILFLANILSKDSYPFCGINNGYLGKQPVDYKEYCLEY